MMRRLVAAVLAAHDRAACAVRAFAAEPVIAEPERVATVSEELSERLEAADAQRAETERRIADLQARHDASMAEVARLEAERVQTERDAAIDRAIEHLAVWRGLTGGFGFTKRYVYTLGGN